MTTIQKLNRVLDILIIVLVILLVAIAIEKGRGDDRKQFPRFESGSFMSDLRTPVAGQMDTLENCQRYVALSAYYAACVANEATTVDAPMTCPATRPEGVTREPQLRALASTLSRLYKSRYQRGQCDTVMADANKQQDGAAIQKDEVEANDKN